MVAMTGVTKIAAGAIQTSLAWTYAQYNLTTDKYSDVLTQALFGVTKVFRYQRREDGRLEWWRDETSSPYKTTQFAYYDNGESGRREVMESPGADRGQVLICAMDEYYYSVVE